MSTDVSDIHPDMCMVCLDGRGEVEAVNGAWACRHCAETLARHEARVSELLAANAIDKDRRVEAMNLVRAKDAIIEAMTKVIDQLLQAAPAQAEPVAWQEIGTAPKDGTWFLGYWPESSQHFDRVTPTSWDEWTADGPRFLDAADHRMEQPTHWMPLPAAPPPPAGEG